MFNRTAALSAEIATLRDHLRKVQSFAASAGLTITPRDALEVIRSICHAGLTGDARAAAVVAHADRVREVARG